MARAAVLCSRAEFASNQDSEGTMRREVIGNYSCLPNTSRGWSKGLGGKFLQN